MKFFYKMNVLLLTIGMISSNAKAQLDSCNVFLKGNYVEVGINWNGAYGSSCAPPSGYHARGSASIYNICDSTCEPPLLGLGFVADPDHDGWSTGTPVYYGDYFTPGYPQEGWSIMADGMQANAWNGPGCQMVTDTTYAFSYPEILDTSIKNAENVAYFDTGSYRLGVWRGMFDSIQIRQITKLDTNADYFTIHVFLKNISSVTKHNIYYLRTVDPDNDESLSGDFTTKNKIEYQLPNPGNKVLVSAQGVHYSGGPLYLGTHDTTAKCFIIKRFLTPRYQNLDSMYNGNGGLGDTTDYLYQDSLTADVGIGLLYKIHDLAPTDSIHIVMAYSFTKNAVDTALNDTTITVSNPQGIASVNNRKNNVRVYPNPFTNELTVTGLSGTDQVNMYNMLGRKVNGQCSIVNNGNTSVIKVGNSMPGGMYVLQVMDNKGNIIAKIPLQKH